MKKSRKIMQVFLNLLKRNLKNYYTYLFYKQQFDEQLSLGSKNAKQLSVLNSLLPSKQQ